VTFAGSTPLRTIDAVILDTEIVGDDPSRARLTEVAALLLVEGKIDETTSWRRVREREDASGGGGGQASDAHEPANGALSFPNLWPELEILIGDRIVVGHALDFDLAVLKNECERGGFEWRSPRYLDVSLLAQVLRPNLPGYALDQLAQWLGVDIDRHRTTHGDAVIAGRIFLALLPKLGELGVRTLADAEQACRDLGARNPPNLLSLMSNIDAAVRSLGEKLPRIDAYPYRHRVGDVMSPAKFTGRDSTVGLAVRRMQRESVSSLFVAPSGREDTTFKPQELGIITERDVLRVIADHGTASLFMPINSIVSAPLLTVPSDAFVYRALGRMRRLKIRHLGVVDESGRVCGAVSARDLSRLRREDVGGLGDDIDEADDVGGLAQAWARVPPVAERLLSEGVSGLEIAAVIAREIGALTRRAGTLARKRMQADALGPPPSSYALVVLGDVARGEGLLKSEQSHALFFTTGDPGSDADGWFSVFADHVAEMLQAAGLPHGRAGVMACNAHWRGSIATWRQRVRDWIAAPDASELGSLDEFFDMRAVHGDVSIADTVRADAFEAVKGQAAFARRLAQASLISQAPRRWFGGPRLQFGRVNVKDAVLSRIAALARAFALRDGVMDRSTVSRLLMAEALEAAPAEELNGFAQAYERATELLLRQQIADIAQGSEPRNTIVVKRLPRDDRNDLMAALKTAARAERRLRTFPDV
jgi:DNA polymerase-3 subunit epsilon/CBS domain-containing protein